MPRSGNGVYSLPANTQGVPNTPIESAKYNAAMADLASDLNAPRPVSSGGTGANSATGAREFLGIGEAGRDNIVTIAHGGTESATAEAARTALGLKIGTDVQAYSALLKNLAAVTGAAANKFPYLTSATAWAFATVSTFARTLLDDADAAAVRTTLGLGGLALLDNADLINQSTSASSITFPVGSTVVFASVSNINRNEAVVLRLSDSNSIAYSADGSGTALAGTWRSRGFIRDDRYMAQRVA